MPNPLSRQNVENNPFDFLDDPAGADGDGFGLVLDGVDGSGHVVDGFSQRIKQGAQHMLGCPLFAEIKLKIRDRESSCQILQQYGQIRAGLIAHRGAKTFFFIISSLTDNRIRRPFPGTAFPEPVHTHPCRLQYTDPPSAEVLRGNRTRALSLH